MNPKIQEYKENPKEVEKTITRLMTSQVYAGTTECESLNEYSSLFTWDAYYEICYDFTPQYTIYGRASCDSFEELKRVWESQDYPDACDIDWEDSLENCGEVSPGHVDITVYNLRLKDDDDMKI